MKLKSTKYLLIVIAIVAIAFQTGCEKQDEWLDVKRNKADVVPETLYDFQSILDNTSYLTNNLTSAAAVGTDDVYLPDANLASAQEAERNLYLWNKNIWINGSSLDWNSFYVIVENANIVLDGLKKIDVNSLGYKDIKGQALFWRAFAFYQLAQYFCRPYSENSASSDLGIPLRTSSDVNIIYKRSALRDTYEQITNDLTEASSLLPSNAKYITRPIKAAALTLLSRVYLNMDDYKQAFTYSDLSLKEKNELLDFNNGVASLSTTYRFPANGTNNPEVLFFAQGGAYNSVIPSTGGTGIVDASLYSSYSDNDLRKTLFYVASGSSQFKVRGTYSGNATPFFGIATNETYLIRAECYARADKTTESLADLNFLLKKRYKMDLFVPLTANSPGEALALVLAEKRKELAFVGALRWEELRRLNKDVRFAKTLTRTAQGNTYTLPPNDPRYVMPIPEIEIMISGIDQNLR